MPFSGFDHELHDPMATYARTALIDIANPSPVPRACEPVRLPLSSIRAALPYFNPRFFRVKYRSDRLEPLDIPSQVLAVPGEPEELVFSIDLGAKEKVTVELQYNPEGEDLPDYPDRTRSFGVWYKDGSNAAWENEITAYRCYTGIVDCFGKSYRGLCLDRLRPDSYHHERLWGQDYYMVGKSAGLGGIGLFEGDTLTRCWGAPGQAPLTYVHEAFGGGPSAAGAVMTVHDASSGEPLVRSAFTLFHGRYENRVKIAVSPGPRTRKAVAGPGMAKFKGEEVTFDERGGVLMEWGRPVDEYGFIGTAFVWRPEVFAGFRETEDTRFVLLKAGEDGSAEYASIGVWWRGSAEQPASAEPFAALVRSVADDINSPVKTAIQ